jgi:hypothetical protein
METSGQLYIPATLPPEKNPSIHLGRGWVNPSDNLDILGEMKNLLPTPGFKPWTTQHIA